MVLYDYLQTLAVIITPTSGACEFLAGKLPIEREIGLLKKIVLQP